MKRSHSKYTYRADRSISQEVLDPIIINGKLYPTTKQRKYAKHEHNRRARNFLKRKLRNETEEFV